MTNIHKRFKDSAWYREEPLKALVVGAGGVGSWLSMFLARANFLPILFDFDRVEEHNLGGQLYNLKNIGEFKTDSTKKLVKELTNLSIDTFTAAYSEDFAIVTPFTFSCPDSIPTRKLVFKKWLENFDNQYSDKPILIDARLEAEQFFIYAVTEESIDEYIKVLEEPISVTSNLNCSYQQTSDVAAICAAYMVNIFKNHVSNIYEKQEVRSVPFKYESFMPILFSNEKKLEKKVTSEEVENVSESESLGILSDEIEPLPVPMENDTSENLPF